MTIHLSSSPCLHHSAWHIADAQWLLTEKTRGATRESSNVSEIPKAKGGKVLIRSFSFPERWQRTGLRDRWQERDVLRIKDLQSRKHFKRGVILVLTPSPPRREKWDSWGTKAMRLPSLQHWTEPHWHLPRVLRRPIISSHIYQHCLPLLSNSVKT